MTEYVLAVTNKHTSETIYLAEEKAKDPIGAMMYAFLFHREDGRKTIRFDDMDFFHDDDGCTYCMIDTKHCILMIGKEPMIKALAEEFAKPKKPLLEVVK